MSPQLHELTGDHAWGLDLRNHPDWAPVQGTLHVPGWRIETWEEPRLPGDIGLDMSLVATFGPVLRMAVADAAENLQNPDSTAGSLRGTHTVRRWLRAEPDVTRALAAASRDLCDPTLRPRQRNPIVTTAVADFDRRTGTLTATRCGDSEVWVKRAGEWSEVFPDDMLTETARAAWAKVRRENPADPPRVVWGHQERVLDDPVMWACQPVGLTVTPRPHTRVVEAVEEVIVTTDGARLDVDRCARLDTWLTQGIQQFPVGVPHPHPSPHGDLAVLHAIREPA